MDDALLSGLAVLSCLGWVGLYWLRDGFWRSDQRLPWRSGARTTWPQVNVIVPARNEAATIDRAFRSLIAQDYPGEVRIVVVDDNSVDDTGNLAKTAAASAPERCIVIQGRPLPACWTGKLWALHQGLEAATRQWPEARYVLHTDADIEHARNNLTRLVSKAESDELDLVSFMVLLRSENAWERLLAPAFVYFFQLLFPFRRVNRPENSLAAAAGGCVLLRQSALRAAGGVAAIRDRLIDDCALAEKMKQNGKIWLGLTTTTRSVRGSEALKDFWNMVARTAFTYLRYSSALLAVTVVGMLILFAAPPVLVVLGFYTLDLMAIGLGTFAWGLMTVTFLPTIRLYRLGGWRSLTLPFAGMLFTAMTVDSARRHLVGSGASWKGRSYAGNNCSGAEHLGMERSDTQ